MSNTMHLWPEVPVRKDGQITVSMTIEAPGKHRRNLWYSIPESYEECLSKNADPFIIAIIYLVMQSGSSCHIHGEVSPSLLYNLNDFQSAWTTWIPTFTKGVIHADCEKEPVIVQQRDEGVVTFSGGVDSCFTVFSQVHKIVNPSPCPLTAGIMVHGFDIPLEQTDTFASAMDRSRSLLSSLDLELIPIKTNYQELGINWTHSFGAAAASCLALFSGRFKEGFISQNLTYGESLKVLEGSNPLTERLFSSDSFKILPGGMEYNRASKIYTMRNWEAFLNYLRVCWQGPKKDRNCCECEKCMRNILAFRALGLGLPTCFSKDVDDHTIKSLNLGSGNLAEVRYGGLAELAKTHGVGGEWLNILEKKLIAIRHLKRTQDSNFWQGYRWLRRRAGKAIAPLRHRNR